MKKDIKGDQDNLKYSEPFISFIRILFVVIVGSGFRSFSSNFKVDEFINTPTIDKFTFLIYFTAGYFFVISDFVFYQFQINDWPYPKKTILRFFEDIGIFFVLYLILNLSSALPTPRNLWYFLLLVGFWHFCVMIWQIHINRQYPQHELTHVFEHLVKSFVYLTIFAFYTYINSGIPKTETSAIDVLWVWLVSILITLVSIERLNRFTNTNS